MKGRLVRKHLGTADEVESYPCSFCSDKPYLTDRGLLKHTESCHPEHLNQVLQEIARIREEWERLEKHEDNFFLSFFFPCFSCFAHISS